ncbi:MAG: RNA polymerase sigma factor, partial [Planctomycetota bacterium]
MMPANDFDRLLEHSRWVRTLGVRLAGANEGEDVAQEAWLVALARGDGVREPAAWLRGVVRKLAGEQRRGAERRARREAAAAVPEGVPGPDELVAEAELTRELIRAVTELEEPFRSTVLLRYSRGLEPDEIARQEGVPAATVRTRLHRAHEKLRARLDRTHGGRAAWALAFVGPGMVEGVTGAVTWTGGLMASKTGLAAALAVVVGVGAWFGLRESGATGAGGPVADEVDEQVEVAREVARAPAAENGGASAGSQRVVVAGAGPAFEELLLYGSVLDAEGQPVELESVAFEDELGHSVSRWKPGTGSYSLAGIR